MNVLAAESVVFDYHVPVLIIGAGACGLCAALAAHDNGTEVVVLERDPLPRGSTALSSGMIPACNTGLQQTKNITDSAQLMAADIQRKANNEVDPLLLQTICEASGATIDWLIEQHGIALELVEGFLYPGHSQLRMHAPPSKTGLALIDDLLAAAQRAGIDIINNALVSDLFADHTGRVHGLRFKRPDGTTEQVACDRLLLACNGYGGNPALLKRYIPEMADALYFGHIGNQGDAVLWGEQLGAALQYMGAYQGHGSVATPHGVLITWALMMEGAIQVNTLGQRFSNEQQGYSEQVLAVLAQPDALAYNIFDQRLHELGMTFEDYRQAYALGAIKSALTIAQLAKLLELPEQALASTIAQLKDYANGVQNDAYGRDFKHSIPLQAPFYGIKVTGALFHTQGGLRIDQNARVLRKDGTALPNLYAAGGAAGGLSGTSVAGYLSGNGLLSAVVLGRLAGLSQNQH